MADDRLNDHLQWLQEWVIREFGEGPVPTSNPWVQIESLDPGWSATISLADTSMQDIDFQEFEAFRSESDWLHCWTDGAVESRYLEWQGRGDSNKLVDIVRTFREWVETRRPTSSHD